MPYLSTVASFGFPDIPTVAMLRAYRELGCVKSQFYRNEAAPPTVADARQMAQGEGLAFDSIHGVFGPAYDPSCPDEATRRHAVEVYRREGELAVQLGGPKVVVHPAPMRPAGEKPTPQAHQARKQALQRTLDELAAIGAKLGVTYLIENLPDNYAFGADPAELAAMLRAMAHPNLRMCFDTGHAHLTTPVGAALTACADVIGYMHVHDNDGRLDNHMIPGTGTLPWADLQGALEQVRQSGSASHGGKSSGQPLPHTLTCDFAAIGAMLELFHPQDVLRQSMHDGLGGHLRKWLALQ